MERRSSFIRRLLVNVLLVILLIFVLVWLFPTKSYFKRLFDDVFTNNINRMQEAGEAYFTNDRLPKEIGDVETITLKEMIDKKLILAFTDRNGNLCNLNKSYVSVTKNEDEYELKTYLSCDEEEAYIIKYLGCTNYCNGLGKCDQDCGSCNNCKEIKRYQFKREITKRVEELRCEQGYYKKDNMCYKTTYQTDTKDATPVYDTTTDIKDATPKYEEKTVEKDATPTYDTDSKYVDAIATTVTNTTYKYLYERRTAREYSAWSDWSENKEYTSSDNIIWGKQELVWNEKNGSKKTTTTKKTVDKNSPIYQVTYDNLIGYYSQYVCTKYNYFMDDQTGNLYQAGSYKEVRRYNSYTIPESTASTTYQVVAINYEQCDGTCTLRPVYTIAVYERTLGLSVTCDDVALKQIPVYGVKKSFVGYDVKQEIVEKYTYYYHTKTRTVTKEATYDTKWSNLANDTNLINQGYSFVRREVESVDTKTTYSCPTDKKYTLSGDKCYSKESVIVGYTCDDGTLKGKKCITKVKELTSYTCPIGYVVSGDRCYKKNESVIVGYTCPASYTLNGKKCDKTTSSTISKNPTKTYKDVTTVEYTWSEKKKLDGWVRTGVEDTINSCK